MNKLIVSVTLLFVGCTLLSSFMEGAGGLVATRLTDNISANVTTIPVASTNGFLTTDVIIIGDENVAYTGTTAITFTGCTRGYNSDAVAHAEHRKVYSSEISPLNVALGFNIASTTATSGLFAVAMIPFKFFTVSVPRMVMFDYSFFTGQLGYLQIFFQVIGVGFALTMAIWVTNTAMGILRP